MMSGLMSCVFCNVGLVLAQSDGYFKARIDSFRIFVADDGRGIEFPLLSLLLLETWLARDARATSVSTSLLHLRLLKI